MKISKIKRSRDAWKEKAKKRGAEIRNARKTSKARKKRTNNTQYKEEIRRLRDELEALRASSNNSTLPAANEAVVQQKTLCVLVVIFGVVSFRSVPRILQIFQPFLPAKTRIAHFTSVINWALRAGIAIFNRVSMIAEPWIAIIDCSIDIGIRKALVVLRVPLNALQNNQRAIGLKDCECIGMEISPTWNGQLVSEALVNIFNKSGFPTAIIKDGGTDLNKGVELLREQKPDQKILVIDDVGHFAANALKALFATSESFVKFTEIISKGAARIRQTNLAWLLPPKIRTKGRFQGIGSVAGWAQKTLALISGKGRAQEGSDVSKARKAFAGLAKLRPFLTRFCFTCAVVEEFLKLMKTKGLNQATYIGAKNILAKLPNRSLVQSRLSDWLEKHIDIHRSLPIGPAPLIVSSDVLESLFGKFKTIIQRSPAAELNRLIYIIPLLCGNHNATNIDSALTECSHIKMLKQIVQTIPQTMRQQRTNKLNKNAKVVPKSGDFSRTKTG